MRLIVSVFPYFAKEHSGFSVLFSNSFYPLSAAMLYPDPYDFLHLSNLNQDWKVHDLFYMKIQWIGRTIPGQGLLEHFLFRFFFGGRHCFTVHFLPFSFFRLYPGTFGSHGAISVPFFPAGFFGQIQHFPPGYFYTRDCKLVTFSKFTIHV